MLRHHVLFSFEEAVATRPARTAVDALRGLEEIAPGYRVVPNLAADRTVDRAEWRRYDWLCVGDFADGAALERFRSDPRHREVLGGVVPLLGRVSALDVEL